MLTTTPPPVPDTDLIYSHITVFPNGAMRILSAIIHLLGSSVLGYCIACRISTVRIKSVADLKSLTWPRVCVMLVLVLSWLFVFGAGILIHGVGMASSFRACSAGIHLCIWLYAISKLLIYAFLIEKVRVVWGIVSQPRLTSPLYIVCLLIMLPFFGVPILMTVGRIAYFRSDMTCVIGLKAFSSLSLLIYDLCINVFMNAMFLWPLLRYKLINPRLRAVARRTLFAAFAALATSIVNIATLTAMKGQLGWVCLGSCGTDVTLNAIVLFWVTSPMADSNTPSNIARVQVQSSASQTEGKPGDGTPQSPVTATSPIVFAPPAVYLSRGSVTSPTMSNKAFEAMRQQDFSDEHNHRRILPLVELPKLTGSSSEGVSISPSDEERGPSNHSRPDSPGRMQSFRRLLGLPPKQNEKDVEVHVSVITQHEIELGNLGNDTRHEDSESIDRAKRKSQWYK